MSRSIPAQAANPATRFFEWGARKGEIHYYDKSTEANVDVPLPFKFLFLDSGYQMGGGKKVGKGKEKEFIGYYSNFIKNLKKDTLIVRDKNGIIKEGLYEEVKSTGAKLVVGIYIGYYDDDKKLQIGYLKIHGSAMGEWWDFAKGKNIEQGAITITRGEELADNDGEAYYVPKFTYSTSVSEETNAAAIELDVQLQAYLKGYFANNDTNGHSPEVTTHDDKPPTMQAALAATASNDAAKRQIASAPSDPFGDMSIPDTEPVDDYADSPF